MRLVQTFIDSRLAEYLFFFFLLQALLIGFVTVGYLIMFSWRITPLTLIGWGAVAVYGYRRWVR